MPVKAIVNPITLIFFCILILSRFYLLHMRRNRKKKCTSKSSDVDIVLTDINLYLCKNTKYFAAIITVKNEN